MANDKTAGGLQSGTLSRLGTAVLLVAISSGLAQPSRHGTWHRYLMLFKCSTVTMVAELTSAAPKSLFIYISGDIFSRHTVSVRSQSVNRSYQKSDLTVHGESSIACKCFWCFVVKSFSRQRKINI